jgi:8-oxo-dGTP pyrophosphatase MutT (NUDIX family)
VTRFTDVVTRLEAALRDALPGADAQALMSPQPRSEWRADFNPARVRLAAGLLLLFPRGPQAHLVLTVRAGTLERHSGQVSLPGGAIDPGETFERAALREAHEEIGLRTEDVQTLGALTPIDIHVSGFRLHPIVGITPAPPALRPSDAEVARILEVPLDRLMDPRSLAWKALIRGGHAVTAPTFVAEDAEIWGATAMVLAEFLTLLGWKGPGPG